MKRFLTKAILLLSLACSDKITTPIIPVTHLTATTLVVGLDTGFRTLHVVAGDSIVDVAPGTVSRCVHLISPDTQELGLTLTFSNGKIGAAQLPWATAPPHANGRLTVDFLDSLDAQAVLAIVKGPCNDTLYSGAPQHMIHITPKY